MTTLVLVVNAALALLFAVDYATAAYEFNEDDPRNGKGNIIKSALCAAWIWVCICAAFVPLF